MKKTQEKFLIVIIGILLFCIALTLVLSIATIIATAKTRVLFTIFKISLSIVIGFLISVISHEAGHLVCGLISGYKFSSFRILSLMMMKENGRTVFRKFSIPGTGGQCIMTPPEGDNQPYTLYLYGGTIANLIFATISVPLCYLTGLSTLIALIFIMIGAFSLYFAFINGVPRDFNGLANDAMNVRLMKSDKSAVQAMMHQLLINDAQTRGKRLCEMPEEWFQIPDDIDRRNTLCTSIKVFACNRLMDEYRFAEANEEMKKLLAGRFRIVGIYRYMLRCDRIYCELLLGGREADISSLYTKRYRQFARAMKSNPSIMRTECVIYAIRDKNRNMAKKARQNFVKRTKNSPFKQDTKFELQLIDLALERAFQ